MLTALGAASARLREKLGESLASIQQFDVPLPQATTASLEALHAYALALDQGRVVPRVEAIPHLQRAIELDPDFALAQALLSGVYANTGRSAEAPALSRRAFELRDRVSERERFFISWRYYIDAAQAWDKALELAAVLDDDVPARGVRVQQSRARLGGVRSARAGRRRLPRSHSSRRPVRSAVRKPCRLADRPEPVRRGEGARCRRPRRTGSSFITIRADAYLLAFIDATSTRRWRANWTVIRRSAEAMWASTWEARPSAFSGRVPDGSRARYPAGIQAARAR